MSDSVLEMFNHFKTILCMCPECNNLMRLSDMHLRAKGRAPSTWLDKYDKSIDKIEEKEDVFSQQERKIRDKANERGRAQVPKLIKKSLDEKFAKLNYDPYDIKAILHPIDFVIFNGMNNDNLKDVVLLSKRTKNPNLMELHRGIADAVRNKKYDWKVIRVSAEGKVEYE